MKKGTKKEMTNEEFAALWHRELRKCLRACKGKRKKPSKQIEVIKTKN